MRYLQQYFLSFCILKKINKSQRQIHHSCGYTVGISSDKYLGAVRCNYHCYNNRTNKTGVQDAVSKRFKLTWAEKHITDHTVNHTRVKLPWFLLCSDTVVITESQIGSLMEYKKQCRPIRSLFDEYS